MLKYYMSIMFFVNSVTHAALYNSLQSPLCTAEYLEDSEDDTDFSAVSDFHKLIKEESLATVCKARTINPDIIHEKDNQGNNALHIALDTLIELEASSDAYANNVKRSRRVELIAIIRILLQHKADREVCNNRGLSVVDKAKNSNNLEIRKLLGIVDDKAVQHSNIPQNIVTGRDLWQEKIIIEDREKAISQCQYKELDNFMQEQLNTSFFLVESALTNKNYKEVQELIEEYQCFMNNQNRVGNTFLHLVLLAYIIDNNTHKNEFIQVIQKCLDLDAHIQIPNKSGFTVCALVQQCNDPELDKIFNIEENVLEKIALTNNISLSPEENIVYEPINIMPDENPESNKIEEISNSTAVKLDNNCNSKLTGYIKNISNYKKMLLVLPAIILLYALFTQHIKN